MATYNSFKRISTDALVNNAVAADDIGTGEIQTGKFAAGAITTNKLANSAVGASQLAATLDISGKSVTYRSIVNADISNTANITGTQLGSGAITTNLGYTPADKDNPVMSGQLKLPNGNSGTAALRDSGGRGVYFDGSDNIYFTSNGGQRLKIDSSGRMTKGVNDTNGTVAFRADGTAGWLYNNSFGGTSWRHINSAFGWSVQNRGGTNCDSDGIFTAPVSGFYQFMFQTYGHNDSYGTPNYIHLSFGRNGGVSFAGGRTPHGIFAHGTTNGPYPHGILMDLSTYLNASDNIRVYTYWAGNQMRFHAAHSIFDGSLVC